MPMCVCIQIYIICGTQGTSPALLEAAKLSVYHFPKWTHLPLFII